MDGTTGTTDVPSVAARAAFVKAVLLHERIRRMAVPAPAATDKMSVVPVGLHPQSHHDLHKKSLKSRKTADRILEKLPNEIWKSCRTKIGKIAERALYRFAMCDKGRYALVEIKLGGERSIQEGVASLDEYLRLVDLRNAVRPVFRMVLTAVGDYAYQRPDGVIVCPISALKP